MFSEIACLQKWPDDAHWIQSPLRIVRRKIGKMRLPIEGFGVLTMGILLIIEALTSNPPITEFVKNKNKTL